MSDKDNLDKIFSELELDILSYSVEQSLKEAGEIFKKVRKFAKDANNDFYTILTSRFMDVNSKPAELEKVSWDSLSGRWQKYKQYVLGGGNRKTGSNPGKGSRGAQRFYYGISPQRKPFGPHLKDVLSGMSAADTLGTPEVNMKGGSSLGGVRLTSNGFNRMPRARDSRGRYIKAGALFMDLEIEVYLTPKLLGRSTKQILNMLAGADDSRFAKKLRGLERQRPLFRPYVLWYLENKRQQLIKKVFGQ